MFRGEGVIGIEGCAGRRLVKSGGQGGGEIIGGKRQFTIKALDANGDGDVLVKLLPELLDHAGGPGGRLRVFEVQE